MIVRVKCFTGMRRFAPADRTEFDIEIEAGASVARLLTLLEVPPDIQPIVAVNGARAETSKPLRDGDKIVLFTPVEGG